MQCDIANAINSAPYYVLVGNDVVLWGKQGGCMKAFGTDNPVPRRPNPILQWISPSVTCHLLVETMATRAIGLNLLPT